MSCNSCCKAFSLIRKEKGCPGCGFSYCSKCLNYKMYLLKLNAEVKVCCKCKSTATCTNKVTEPPATHFENTDLSVKKDINKNENQVEEEIKKRLLELKEEKLSSDSEIAERLKKLKDVPSTSQAQLEQRLANFKGVPLEVIKNKPVMPTPDLRTVEEQADDLLKQFISESSIDKKYEDDFDCKINDIEQRLQKLKGSTVESDRKINIDANYEETEDDVIHKIIEKAILGSDNETINPSNDELPFCEICNEDADMRCLGCKYLLCKKCFMDHKDDDDGCNKYESYTASKH